MIEEIIAEMKAKVTASCGMLLTLEETKEVLAVLATPAAVQAAMPGVESIAATLPVESETVPAIDVSEKIADETVELKGPLPADFPGHAALAEAGINTYHQLRKQRDGEGLTAVAGIGDATAEKIEQALKG